MMSSSTCGQLSRVMDSTGTWEENDAFRVGWMEKSVRGDL